MHVVVFGKTLTSTTRRAMPGAEVDKRGIPLHSPMEKMPPLVVFYPVFNGVLAGFG